MRVCVYEYLTAEGLGRDPAGPMHSMYREGRAMRDAVVADFRAAPGVEVVTFPDDTVTGRAGLRDAAQRCDRTLVIAPETGGILAALADDVVDAGGVLLGPTPAAIRLTSDKLALATHWRERGVPTPATTDRLPTPCEDFPVVWKARDGAGSSNVFRLDSAVDVVRARTLVGAGGGSMVLQEFAAGMSASAAFLCGPGGAVALPPALQHLSTDGSFRYLGGELPLTRGADRAVRLARRAIDCVPGLLGYVGVDLILGDRDDGSRDFAIEINPRLTTSYVGYRSLTADNLAWKMVEVAEGRGTPGLTWKPQRLRFTTDRCVTSYE